MTGCQWKWVLLNLLLLKSLPQLHTWQVTSFEGLGVGLDFPPLCFSSMKATNSFLYTTDWFPWGIWYQGVSLEKRDISDIFIFNPDTCWSCSGPLDCRCVSDRTHTWLNWTSNSVVTAWGIWRQRTGEAGEHEWVPAGVWARAAEYRKENSTKDWGGARGNAGGWEGAWGLDCTYACISTGGGKTIWNNGCGIGSRTEHLGEDVKGGRLAGRGEGERMSQGMSVDLHVEDWSMEYHLPPKCCMVPASMQPHARLRHNTFGRWEKTPH